MTDRSRQPGCSFVNREAGLLRFLQAGACLLAGTLLSFNSHAESRALIIGVGDYESEKVSDLPGLDIDVDTMKGVAMQLGYPESAIKVLQDSEATLANIQNGLTEWLVEGVTAEDQVLIYYTGHGSQTKDRDGDESDGLDEFLLAHDFNVASDNVIYGALDDDSFYQALQKIPTDNVLLMVDACHSGTGFKNFNGGLTGAEGGQPKFHYIETAGASVDGAFAAGEKGVSDDKFVALMASRDDEVAIATSRGSVFTLGIQNAIQNSLAAGLLTTPRKIIESTREFVKSELKQRPELIFTPQIGGSSVLMDKPLELVVTPTNRDLLLSWAAENSVLSMATNKTTFPLGDKTLRVTVDVPGDGYLNIVTVDPNDAAVVLYPNEFNRDNAVNAGSVSLPTQEMNFDLEAQGPVGEHVIFAFWTEEPVNMYEEGEGARDVDGKLLQTFNQFSGYTASRFVAVAKDAGTGAGVATVQMVP